MFSISKMIMRESLWFCAKERKKKSQQNLRISWCQLMAVIVCCVNLQHSRWAWRRSFSQCGRSCCHYKPQSGGSRPSPGRTVGRRSWSARSPPSWKPETNEKNNERTFYLNHPKSEGKTLRFSFFKQFKGFQKSKEAHQIRTRHTPPSGSGCSPSHTPWCSGSWR